jgi:hypothetical protein
MKEFLLLAFFSVNCLATGVVCHRFPEVFANTITLGSSPLDLSTISESERLALFQELEHRGGDLVQVHYFVGGMGVVSTFPVVVRRVFEQNGSWFVECSNFTQHFELLIGDLRAISSPTVIRLGQGTASSAATQLELARTRLTGTESNEELVRLMTGVTSGIPTSLITAREAARAILEGLSAAGQRTQILELDRLNIRAEQIPEFMYVITGRSVSSVRPYDIRRLNLLMQEEFGSLYPGSSYPHAASVPGRD